MWLYRQMLKIPWTNRIINESNLERIEKEKELITTIKSRKLKYMGHILKNNQRYKVLQLILQEKVEGSAGTRLIFWLINLYDL